VKALIAALSAWLVLAGLSWILATTAGQDMNRTLSLCGLYLLPAMAVMYTVKYATEAPEVRFASTTIPSLMVMAWIIVLILAQGRAETNPAEAIDLGVAFGFAAILAAIMLVKTRAFPEWHTVRAVGVNFAIPAITGAVLVWTYEHNTKAIASRAEARWAQIGMPLDEFEKSIRASQENAGSQALRRALREEVGSHFYRDDTAMGAQEPDIPASKVAEHLFEQAHELLNQNLPASDDVELSPQQISVIQSMAPALEENYRRILASAPPTWNSDPHDGYSISVPNFLGLRKFAQVTAADALCRFAAGDSEAAAQAVDAGLRVSDGLRREPTLVSLMLGVSVDALLAAKQVRLPAEQDGLEKVARDTSILRTELLRRLQMEGWASLRFSDQIVDDVTRTQTGLDFLPRWAQLRLSAPIARRQSALASLNGAGHAAIQKSVDTFADPEFGARADEAISRANPCILDSNVIRAAMRIHVTLLLREQAALIREVRTRLAAGLPVESRDSVVLPNLRWELKADLDKKTVSTRLDHAPEWITNHTVAPDDFWILPLDGSVAWQFHRPKNTTSR
jgi:hypothetical protein